MYKYHPSNRMHINTKNTEANTMRYKMKENVSTPPSKDNLIATYYRHDNAMTRTERMK